MHRLAHSSASVRRRDASVVRLALRLSAQRGPWRFSRSRVQPGARADSPPAGRVVPLCRSQCRRGLPLSLHVGRFEYPSCNCLWPIPALTVRAPSRAAAATQCASRSSGSVRRSGPPAWNSPLRLSACQSLLLFACLRVQPCVRADSPGVACWLALLAPCRRVCRSTPTLGA